MVEVGEDDDYDILRTVGFYQDLCSVEKEETFSSAQKKEIKGEEGASVKGFIRISVVYTSLVALVLLVMGGYYCLRNRGRICKK